MKLIAFHNIKGGVGKTASAVNIAYQASASGIPTLLWDLDPQGAASWYFSRQAPSDAKAAKLVKGKTPIGRLITESGLPQLDLIPSDVSFRNMDLQLEKHGHANALQSWVEPLAEDYALVILDCPPSLSRLAENIFAAADRIYVPMIPTWLSVNSWEQLQAFVKDKGLDRKRFHPFFTLVDRRKRLHREFLEKPPEDIKRRLAGYIPYASDIERMGEYRQPVALFAPRSPAALAYRLMWEQMRKQLKL
ncbi:ParA family protein [Mangrovitalea sediminis]|uniref:ParA family protein n=1 Tax=Mangrovitalea sediminis TaxID=1982043 RepID=UPI000BE4D7EA|nr:AAA family ATPase [Mangrovitalea sediminis]